MAAAPDFLSPEHSHPPLSVHTPGPLSLSQLDTSHVLPRRGKLEPLPVPKERKPRRKSKSKATDPREAVESGVEGKDVHEQVLASSEPTLPHPEDSLVSIRARLDPFYQSRSAVSSEPELVPPAAAETDSEPAAELKKKKKRKRRKEGGEKAPPQEENACVDADIEPLASRTVALPRDDPQADGESSPTLSEDVVAGKRAGSGPAASLKPVKRKKRQPRPDHPEAVARQAVARQTAPPPVDSPSPPPPQDVHVTVSTAPVQSGPPSEIEVGQRDAHTPTREQGLREHYCRPAESEGPLAGGGTAPQVLQGAPTSPVEDTAHEQEDGTYVKHNPLHQ